jgi:sugar phosphate isomerase/epimerase
MSFTSRRTFLKTSAAAAAVTSVASRLSAAPLSLPIGLQLYSVRELLPKDFDGTLQQIAAAGYTEVEAAGYYNRTAKEFRHAMDQAGLRCTSTHHALADLTAHLDEFIEYGHTLGLSYIICPWASRPGNNGALTMDDWHWVADEFNRIGEKVKAAGMVFGYHNHSREFASVKSEVIYDELLIRTDPKLVVFEMDCGWVFAAGRDPIHYLSKTPERFPLLHVKDMARNAKGEFASTVLGQGGMDYGPILRAATGLKHYFIEQEEFSIDTMDALQQDADYMRKLNV